MDNISNVENQNKDLLFKVLIPILIVVAVIGAFLLGTQFQNKETAPAAQQYSDSSATKISTRNFTDESGWKTFTQTEIGIEFDYPSEWGNIMGAIENGCSDWYNDKKPYTVPPSCSNLFFAAVPTHVSLRDFFQFDSRSNFYIYANARKMPRDGGLPFIENLADIENFCSKSWQSVKTCDVYSNKNGVRIARLSQDAGKNELGEYPAGVYYHIYTQNTHFPGVSFSSKPEFQVTMDKIIDGLRLLKTN